MYELEVRIQAQEQEDKFQEQLDEQVLHLTSKGQEYYPYTKENFGEAISNLTEDETEFLAKVCEEFAFSNTPEILATTLNMVVKEYWEEAAEDAMTREKVSY